MQCPKCQENNPNDALVCRRCASALVILCPRCGAANLPGDRLCEECGHTVTGCRILPLDKSRTQALK